MSIPGRSAPHEARGDRGNAGVWGGTGSKPWQIWLVGAVVLCAMAMACLLYSPGIDGVRLLIRATARTSLLFFLMAYTAQAAVMTWPGAWSSWQRRYRRQWGWLLVTSHSLHAAGIISLSMMAPALFATLSPPVQRIGPGLAYVFIVLMGLTSFDRTAAWLGKIWWARLHTWGQHYIWLSFLVANGKRVAAHPEYALPTLVLLAAFVWRLLASRRQGVKRCPCAQRLWFRRRGAFRAEPTNAGPASPTASHPAGSGRH